MKLDKNRLSFLSMPMSIHQIRWMLTIPDHDDQTRKTMISLTSLTMKDMTALTPAKESDKSKLDSRSGHIDTLAAAEDNSTPNIKWIEPRNSTTISLTVWDVITQVNSGHQNNNRQIRCLNTAMSICINISVTSFIFKFINKNYLKLFSSFIKIPSILKIFWKSPISRTEKIKKKLMKLARTLIVSEYCSEFNSTQEYVIKKCGTLA